MDFVKAQFFLTRRCNLSCSYCNIIKKRFERELNINEWKEAVSILDNLGIKYLKIMGGEPTIVKGLNELIRFIDRKTDIDVAIFSNSIISEKKLSDLINAGMENYITSIEMIKPKLRLSGDILKKSNKGLETLMFLKKMNLKSLSANIVVGRHNIKEVPETIDFLSKMGVYSTLSPIHTGKEGFWEFRSKESEFRLTNKDIRLVEEMSERLLDMKREGLLISNSYSFLKSWPKHTINLDWNCINPPVLWVDSDGKMMCCCDIRGDTSRMSIFDLMNKENHEKLVESLKEDARKCPGCFYNCQFDGKMFV